MAIRCSNTKILIAVLAILIQQRVAAFSIGSFNSRQLTLPLQPWRSSKRSMDTKYSSCIHPHQRNYKKSPTSLQGLDFEAIENDEECDLGTDLHHKLPDKCIELPMPNQSMLPLDVVSICMDYLQKNDDPKQDSGLEVCYNFSSDSYRASNGGSLENFLRYANNPTFQSMVNCKEWEVLNVGPEIEGTNTRGAMMTVMIKVVQKDIPEQQVKNDRRFLWTLMKERRPPRQGYFLVHECIVLEDNLLRLDDI